MPKPNTTDYSQRSTKTLASLYMKLVQTVYSHRLRGL